MKVNLQNMVMEMFNTIILALIGFSGGIVIGSAFIAVIVLLNIIPRLAQMSHTEKFISVYEKVMILSVVLITLLDFFDVTLKINEIYLIPIGLIMGIFIGILAAALAEVIDVVAVFERRVKIKDYIFYILLAIALGKTVGSLVQWLILER
ncbi:stage V sporulation protein AB [Caloranaerobacter azorensis]|uniref:Stage V sporulation protein AB n=3 Tax=Caloranaerobacter azorensis TaxID=116090 RepID=A0A1M5V7N1_9FIRM|nr:stage V sporulation protein AB [Caloranaerobacter azorensis]SHH71148.1 stage V sporulation protein AB [Caloranaerobacter azorensis DSM 13643]